MKTISTTAIVALMTASIGLAAIAPAMAQPAPTPAQTQIHPRGDGPDRAIRHHRRGQIGGLGDLLRFGRDAERIEIALVRLSYRLDLTPEQKALLEDFKTAALAAQTDFATAAEAAHPDFAAGERPDMVDRLDMSIAIETAHVAALTAVQPALEAFFDSLTEQQKASLSPRHRRPHTDPAAESTAPIGD